MGNYIATHFTKTDVMPVPQGPPTFDPMLGFPKGRAVRDMRFDMGISAFSLIFAQLDEFTELPVSDEDMIAAKIPLDKRDFCAHKYMDLLYCMRRHYPFMLKCAHERHEYFRCEAEDTTLRLKEYERERRLLERKKRIQQKQAIAA